MIEENVAMPRARSETWLMIWRPRLVSVARANCVLERQSGGEHDPRVAVVDPQRIAAPREGEPRAGLDRFVALGAHRDRDLALAVELETARVDRTLEQHIAQHRQQQRRVFLSRRIGDERARFHRGSPQVGPTEWSVGEMYEENRL